MLYPIIFKRSMADKMHSSDDSRQVTIPCNHDSPPLNKQSIGTNINLDELDYSDQNISFEQSMNVMLQDQSNGERRLLNPKKVVPALLISSIQSTLLAHETTSSVASGPTKRSPLPNISPDHMSNTSNMRVVGEKQYHLVETERAKFDQTKEDDLEQLSQIKEPRDPADSALASKEIVMSSTLDRASVKRARDVTNRIAKEAILNAADRKKHGVSEYHKYRKQSSPLDGYNNLSIEQNCAISKDHQDEPHLDSGVNSALLNYKNPAVSKQKSSGPPSDLRTGKATHRYREELDTDSLVGSTNGAVTSPEVAKPDVRLASKMQVRVESRVTEQNHEDTSPSNANQLEYPIPDCILTAQHSSRRKAYNSLKVDPMNSTHQDGFKKVSRGSLPSPSSRGSEGDYTQKDSPMPSRLRGHPASSLNKDLINLKMLKSPKATPIKRLTERPLAMKMIATARFSRSNEKENSGESSLQTNLKSYINTGTTERIIDTLLNKSNQKDCISTGLIKEENCGEIVHPSNHRRMNFMMTESAHVIRDQNNDICSESAQLQLVHRMNRRETAFTVDARQPTEASQHTDLTKSVKESIANEGVNLSDSPKPNHQVVDLNYSVNKVSNSFRTIKNRVHDVGVGTSVSPSRRDLLLTSTRTKLSNNLEPTHLLTTERIDEKINDFKVVVMSSLHRSRQRTKRVAIKDTSGDIEKGEQLIRPSLYENYDHANLIIESVQLKSKIGQKVTSPMGSLDLDSFFFNNAKVMNSQTRRSNQQKIQKLKSLNRVSRRKNQDLPVQDIPHDQLMVGTREKLLASQQSKRATAMNFVKMPLAHDQLSARRERLMSQGQPRLADLHKVNQSTSKDRSHVPDTNYFQTAVSPRQIARIKNRYSMIAAKNISYEEQIRELQKNLLLLNMQQLKSYNGNNLSINCPPSLPESVIEALMVGAKSPTPESGDLEEVKLIQKQVDQSLNDKDYSAGLLASTYRQQYSNLEQVQEDESLDRESSPKQLIQLAKIQPIDEKLNGSQDKQSTASGSPSKVIAKRIHAEEEMLKKLLEEKKQIDLQLRNLPVKIEKNKQLIKELPAETHESQPDGVKKIYQQVKKQSLTINDDDANQQLTSDQASATKDRYASVQSQDAISQLSQSHVSPLKPRIGMSITQPMTGLDLELLKAESKMLAAAAGETVADLAQYQALNLKSYELKLSNEERHMKSGGSRGLRNFEPIIRQKYLNEPAVAQSGEHSIAGKTLKEHSNQAASINKVAANTAIRSSPVVETNSTAKDAKTRGKANEDALSSDTFINKDLSNLIMNEQRKLNLQTPLILTDQILSGADKVTLRNVISSSRDPSVLKKKVQMLNMGKPNIVESDPVSLVSGSNFPSPKLMIGRFVQTSRVVSKHDTSQDVASSFPGAEDITFDQRSPRYQSKQKKNSMMYSKDLESKQMTIKIEVSQERNEAVDQLLAIASARDREILMNDVSKSDKNGSNVRAKEANAARKKPSPDKKKSRGGVRSRGKQKIPSKAEQEHNPLISPFLQTFEYEVQRNMVPSAQEHNAFKQQRASIPLPSTRQSPMQRLQLQNEMNEMIQIRPMRKKYTNEGLQLVEHTGRSELTSLCPCDDIDEQIVMHTSIIDQDTPEASSRQDKSPIKGWQSSKQQTPLNLVLGVAGSMVNKAAMLKKKKKEKEKEDLENETEKPLSDKQTSEIVMVPKLKISTHIKRQQQVPSTVVSPPLMKKDPPGSPIYKKDDQIELQPQSQQLITSQAQRGLNERVQHMDKKKLLLQLPSLIKKRQSQQDELMRQQFETRVHTLHSNHQQEPLSGDLGKTATFMDSITSSQQPTKRKLKKLYLPMPDYQSLELSTQQITNSPARTHVPSTKIEQQESTFYKKRYRTGEFDPQFDEPGKTFDSPQVNQNKNYNDVSIMTQTASIKPSMRYTPLTQHAFLHVNAIVTTEASRVNDSMLSAVHQASIAASPRKKGHRRRAVATSLTGTPQFFIGSDLKALKLREKNREFKNMKNYRAVKKMLPPSITRPDCSSSPRKGEPLSGKSIFLKEFQSVFTSHKVAASTYEEKANDQERPTMSVSQARRASRNIAFRDQNTTTKVKVDAQVWSSFDQYAPNSRQGDNTTSTLHKRLLTGEFRHRRPRRNLQAARLSQQSREVAQSSQRQKINDLNEVGVLAGQMPVNGLDASLDSGNSSIKMNDVQYSEVA